MKTLSCFLLSFFAILQLNAQINVSAITIAPRAAFHIDIVALARASAYEKDFEKADRLLTAYNSRPNDFDALSLHAQVLYWMKATDRSIEVYEKTISLFPERTSIQLDYARVLFHSNRLTKARKLLNIYRQSDSSNVEAAIMATYINLWTGQTGLAVKKAKLLLQKYPGNTDANNIIANANSYTVPYLKTGVETFSDDQPLKGNAFYAEAGMYKSWLFAPTAQATVYQYSSEKTPYHSSWMQFANTVQLNMKNKIKVKVGGFTQNGIDRNLTGGVEISQKVAQDFSLLAGIEKRPYQFAISSIQTLVMEDVSTLSLSYSRKNKWFGKAAYEILSYEDNNKIKTAYLWILAPVISRPRFSLSGGYSFRYADAEKSNFVSKRSVDEVINSRSYDGLAGVYAPYFTPENQKVHAVLAGVKFLPAKKLAFSSRLSIGFSAKADNPYLWLGKSGNDFAFYNGVYQVDFMPASWVNELRLYVSDKFSLAANYSYDKLLFYNSHRGGIELKYLFVK